MSIKNRILYLSYEGMTDALGQSQVLAYMEKLSAYYDISIISCEKKDRYQTFGREIEEKCERAGITWHPLFYTKSPPILSTVYDVWKMMRKAKSLFREKPFDIVHCRSYITSLVGIKLKEQFGAKYIFDMRGFWIDEKVEAGYWDTRKWLYRVVVKYLRKKETLFFNQADIIVSLTQAGKNAIVAARPACENKIYIVPTCVNLEVFKPYQVSTRERIRKELGIPADSFVLLYSGGYGANYDIDFLKTVFKKIKEHKPGARILILSKDGVTGLENDPIRADAVAVTLPYSKVGEYLMAGNIGVINYTNHFSVAGRSPTKLGEYWASGLPAVAPKGIGDVDYLFSHYKNSGSLYDEADFTNKLDEIVTTDKEVLRSYAEDYFSLDNGVKKYNTIYRILLGQGLTTTSSASPVTIKPV
jgi:glycosyltransferase involved in cell wall biosynthesis